jgi:hypothetical protein
MKEICEALDLPCYFIRFNPDDYKTKSGKITSCFSENKEGKPCVKKSKKDEWNQRLETLKQKILEVPVQEITYMFYDE